MTDVLTKALCDLKTRVSQWKATTAEPETNKTTVQTMTDKLAAALGALTESSANPGDGTQTVLDLKSARDALAAYDAQRDDFGKQCHGFADFLQSVHGNEGTTLAAQNLLWAAIYTLRDVGDDAEQAPEDYAIPMRG